MKPFHIRLSLNNLKFCKKKEYLFGDIYAEEKFPIGEFARVQIDNEKNQVIATRDAIGVIPLYYRLHSPDEIEIGTHLALMLQSTVALTVDEDYLLRIENKDFSEQEATPFREIKRLPRGCQFFFSKEGFHVERYWHLGAASFLPIDSYDFFEKIFTQRLRKHVLIGSLLSSGLDSAFITVGFAKAAHKIGHPLELHSYSMDFDEPTAAEPERLRKILNCGQWHQHRLHFERLPHYEYAWSEEERRSNIYYSSTLWLYKPMLRLARSHGVPVVMTGHGGDDIFSSSSNFLADLSVFRNFKDMYFELKSSYKKIDLLPRFFYHVIWPRLPEFWQVHVRKLMGRDVQTYLESHRHADNEVQSCLYRRFVLHGGHSFALEAEQEFARLFGIRMSYPLYDPRIIQLAFSLTPESYVSRGEFKPYLRRAAGQILPEDIASVRSRQHYDIISQQIESRSISNNKNFAADIKPSYSDLTRQNAQRCGHGKQKTEEKISETPAS